MTITSGALAGSDPALQERGEHFRLLYESALALDPALDLDALLPVVLERVRALLRADHASIWLPDDGALMRRLASGAEPGPDAAVLSAALETSRAAAGRIDVAGPARGEFDAADRALLQDFAPLAGAAVAAATTRRGDSRAADLTLLLEISREITASLDLDRVLRSVVNLSAAVLQTSSE